MYVRREKGYPEKDNTEKYQEARVSFVLELQKGIEEWLLISIGFEANIKKTKYSGFTMEVMK